MTWRWPRLIIVQILLLLAVPSMALAHPLGNFTINHYSRIDPAADGVQVLYVLDMAEIPTFQEQVRIDADRDGRVSDAERDQYGRTRAEEIRHGLRLTLDGTPVDLRTVRVSATLPPGQGGLQTLRLEATFASNIPLSRGSPTTLTYRDENDPGRLGWREIVARPGASDTRIEQSTVPAKDRSDELRVYPDDMLSSPLDVRDARVTFVPGSSGAGVVERDPGGTLDRGTDAFAELASTKTLTPTAILVALVTALVLGAFHALSPGHGKTVVAAYLVGSRGTARHAMFLGATVTATHTAGVYALGAVTLFLSEYVLPERLYPVLGVISGLSVVAIGGSLFAGRLRGVLAHRGAGSGDMHGHGQVHRHGGVAHSHVPPGTDGSPVTWRSLLTLGVTGGLLPCPSALVVLLSAIALHRVGFGLLLIVTFSLGLAGVLVAIGLVLVYARDVLERFSVGGSVATRLMPVVSAFLILVAGAVITVQALPGLR